MSDQELNVQEPKVVEPSLNSVSPTATGPSTAAPEPTPTAVAGKEDGLNPTDGFSPDVAKAFEKRIGAEVAKRKELESRIAQFESKAGSPNKAEESFAFDGYESWKKQNLNGADSAQASTFFDGFVQALTSDIDRAVSKYIDDYFKESADPLFKWKESTESKEFYSSNPGAESKRDEIEDMLKEIPKLSREQAWRIVNYGNTSQAPARKNPPPGARPGTPGAPSGGNGIPRGKGIGAIVEHVMNQKGI